VRIHILTLFPEMFRGPFDESIIKRARANGLVEIVLHNIRDFAHDKHKVVDDYPFGGGPGMVMKPGPIFEAVEAVQADIRQRLGKEGGRPTPVILLSAQGQPFTQRIAQELAASEELVLVCGHYEGVDARVEEHLATHLLSIGDYVLTGGELPAMVVVDAVVRLLPGVLHDIASAQDDSFTSGLLQHPQYTRPRVFRGMEVPPVLLSGNHAEIARWRRRQALLRTLHQRPDLLAKAELTPAERAFLEAMRRHKGLGP
jgi:tRNA (guanine37-N1)-methyltransferase